MRVSPVHTGRRREFATGRQPSVEYEHLEGLDRRLLKLRQRAVKLPPGDFKGWVAVQQKLCSTIGPHAHKQVVPALQSREAFALAYRTLHHLVAHKIP